MSPELRDRRRLAEQARQSDGDAAALVRAEVVESWDRCRTIPVDAPPPRSEPDVDESWRASPVRRAAGDLLDRLADVAAAEDYVAAVLDAEGTIVWNAAGREMTRLAERANFVRGTNWSEAVAGTNAPGLTLATGQESAVFAAEHWCEPVHDWVCYSAPLRTPSGRLVGVLDLSARWDRASPLAATTVSTMAQLIGHQLGDIDVGAPRLSVRVLGQPCVTLDGRILHCSPRQLELLAILALRSSASLEQLHDALYGDRSVSVATVKAEVSHLRRLLEGAIGSRPYRLTLDVHLDVIDVLDALGRGDLERATALYVGELLPMSNSPVITETRHHLEVAMRNALLATGTPEQLLRYARVHPFDLDVLACAGRRADPSSPVAAEAAARAERARMPG
jgi:hypothetical protein